MQYSLAFVQGVVRGTAIKRNAWTPVLVTNDAALISHLTNIGRSPWRMGTSTTYAVCLYPDEYSELKELKELHGSTLELGDVARCIKSN